MSEQMRLIREAIRAGLTPVQVRMVAILYVVNGTENARQALEHWATQRAPDDITSEQRGGFYEM